MQDFLNQVRDSVSITDVVQEKVSLTKKGREYLGLCPFHNEKTPSFYVNPQKGFYYCFGCGAKGNIFSFYQEVYGMSFTDALKTLAQKAGLSIPNNLNLAESFKEDTKKKALINITEEAKNYFTNNLFLPEGKNALNYLKNRGLTKETIEVFNLGMSFNSSKSLWEALEKKGVYDEDIIEIGLKNYNQKGEIYDFFRNRIIFPIKDNLGKTIAFGGRGLGDELPKYINSKESYIFHKKNTLFNLNLALQNLKDKSLIVVEGYMDVISLYNNGFKTAVAGLGTSITEEHIKIINKYDKSPIFCLDGDNAGIKATKRVIDLYLDVIEIGMNPRFVILEDSQDPDSYILKEGKEKFQECLESSKSLSQMLWLFESLNQDLSIPEVSMKVLRELEKKSSKIKDNQLKGKYLSFFKNKIYDYGKNNNSILYKGSKVYAYDQAEEKKLDYSLERDSILIACVLCYPEILYDVEEKLGLCNFKDSSLQKLKNVLLQNIDLSEKDMTPVLVDLQNECNYVLNMSTVKLKLQNMLTKEDAKNIFNESYNLILVENLEQEKQQTINKIKQLGNMLGNENNYEKEEIKNKIQILMKQQVEISKHIDILIKGKN